MVNHSLEELVDLSKTGDREAFSEIVRRMQQNIFQYCYPMVGNRQDAEDIVQEVFVRAYGNLGKYNESGCFTGWLFTMAHRICLNKLRKSRRFLALFRRVSNEEALRKPYDNVDELSGDILSLLDSLNPRIRGIVILKVLHEMSYEEISNIVGISSVNLRKQFERARKQLQRANEIEQDKMKREAKYEY